MRRGKFNLVLIGVILLLLTSSVYAVTKIIEAVTVSYDNENSKSAYSNVQDAIDDLYKLSSNTENNLCLNVAEPNLGNELVPVTIADDGTVTMVDSNSSDWYDYCDRVWANAVILIDEPSITYVVGDTILEDDIQSYFVWIPKYKYKLWNVDSTTTDIIGYRTIDIVFDTEDTTDIEGVCCKTPMVSGESGNCDDGEYMTHPAFISLGVDGFWVGKFETGYNGATKTSEAQVDTIDISKIIIKPNVYSWRSIKVYNMFMNGYNYKTNLNSHMMKNTEWGAVAYLSHSECGINTEINLNNNSDYITGYSSTVVQHDYPGTSGTTSSVTTTYNKIIGYKASTTGNISGIYDMSGGSWEYVASYLSGNVGNSGFEDISNEAYIKYLDVYTKAGYTGRILGDATGEMAPFSSYTSESGSSYTSNQWYNDYSNFISSSRPWFGRGGRYNGIIAGQFYFHSADAAGSNRDSFRIVLSP
jgi:hypothetical protein